MKGMSEYARGFEDGKIQARTDLNAVTSETIWLLHEIPGEGRIVTVSWVKPGGGIMASVSLRDLERHGEVRQT